MQIQTVEEKREDDAYQAWAEYSKQYNMIAVSKSTWLITEQAFIAGYMAGREDGKIGV